MAEKEGRKYNHGEAFATMHYKCKECGNVELLWNSRDGVTPFILDCPKCNGSAQHINWHMDRYRPNYIPPIGSRVFFSCKTNEEIVQDIFDTVTEERWEEIKDKWASYCKDRFELIWGLLRHAITDEHKFEHPHTAIVTTDNIENFLSPTAKNYWRIKNAIGSLHGFGYSAVAAGEAMKAFAQKLTEQQKHDIMDKIEKENLRIKSALAVPRKLPGKDESE